MIGKRCVAQYSFAEIFIETLGVLGLGVRNYKLFFVRTSIASPQHLNAKFPEFKTPLIIDSMQGKICARGSKCTIFLRSRLRRSPLTVLRAWRANASIRERGSLF